MTHGMGMKGTQRRGAKDQLTQSELCGVADEPGAWEPEDLGQAGVFTATW